MSGPQAGKQLDTVGGGSLAKLWMLQGGGVVALKAAPLPAGKCMPPLQLKERGQVTSIFIEAIAFGRLDVPVAERMAAAAEKTLKKARGRTDTKCAK